MKRLVFVLSVLVTLSGCDEPEENDPFLGRWEYRSSDIIIEFDLVRSGSSYKLQNIVTGSEPWTQSEIRDAKPRKEIGTIIASKNITGVAFFAATADGSTIHSDSVMYQSGANKKWSYNQILNRK